jgi:hypothetical protein
MYHQLKITSMAFIVALVPFLFLSSPANAHDFPPIAGLPEAKDCKGWVCWTPGQFCNGYKGTPGTNGKSYVCAPNPKVKKEGNPMKWRVLSDGQVTTYFTQKERIAWCNGTDEQKLIMRVMTSYQWRHEWDGGEEQKKCFRAAREWGEGGWGIRRTLCNRDYKYCTFDREPDVH